MPTYRTHLNDFVLDQIGFVECKLHEAVRDAASQISAITEASGVVPQLRERMFSEDQDKTVQCIQALSRAFCPRCSALVESVGCNGAHKIPERGFWSLR